MVKGRKSLARGKSPAAPKEVPEKTPKPRGRSYSRPSIKDRKPSQTRSKSRSRKETESKPRGRSRSRSRSRSKSKSKSPKTRGRSRSRSRKGAPPTRFSARSKSKTRSSNKTSESPSYDELADIVQQKKISLVLKNVLHDDFPAKESKLNEIIRRSISREISQEKANAYRVPTYPTTLKNLKEIDAKNLDGMSQEIPKIIPRKKQSFTFSAPDWLTSFSGLVIPPLVVLILHLACNRNQCTVSKFHIPRNWKYYFNFEAVAIVTGFVLLQALFSLLPIGKRVDGPPGVNGSLQYRCNGLLSTVLTVCTVAALWHHKFPVTIVYDKLVSLLVASTLIAYIFGLILYVKGGRAPVPGLNPTGIFGSRLYKFYVGQELNPFFFGKINTKTLLLRTYLNGMLLINGLLALKAYEAKHELTHTLVTCVVLNALLVIDSFWFEDSFPCTYEAMYEGTGCALTLSYFLYPFLPSLITKYIIQHKIQLPVYGLVAIVIAFVIGFFIYRASNLQKAAFRKCPLNPALAHFETISTTRGKKLLVSGWWGWVRHPNYLGNIILYWAWASISGYSHVIPYFVPLIISIMLMRRAKCVDQFCSQRYQSSWEEYCSRVPQRIFPWVY